MAMHDTLEEPLEYDPDTLGTEQASELLGIPAQSLNTEEN